MCAHHGKEKTGFAHETIKYLEAYNWPGNVRELENVVERAVLLSKHTIIRPEDLTEHIVEFSRQQNDDVFKPMTLREALEEPERKIIKAALQQNNWNRQMTAEMLGINRTTLYKKMKHFQLEVDPATQDSES